MHRKITALILAIFAISIAACGDNEQASPPAQPPAAQAEQAGSAPSIVRQYCIDIDAAITDYASAKQLAGDMARANPAAAYQQDLEALDTFVNELLAIKPADDDLADRHDLWVIPIKAYRDQKLAGNLESLEDDTEVNHLAIQDQLTEGKALHNRIEDC